MTNILSKSPIPVEDYTELAYEVLKAYEISNPEPNFLRHNENITFKVKNSDRSRPLLLRIHHPTTANFDRSRQTEQAICSELMWLEALTDDTDITAQKPVRTKDGELVSFLSLSNTNVVSCSVLEWIEGRQLPQDSADARDFAQCFGKMVAHLHNHASTWHIPASFFRPKYEPDFVQTRIEMLQPGLQFKLFGEDDFHVLTDTAGEITALIDSIGIGHNSWGLIHSDLQGGNVLAHNGDVRPIDFSLSGFGHFLFDLGVCVPCLRVPLRTSFLEGYTALRILPDQAIRLMEAFSIVGIVSCFALHILDPHMHEWLRRRIPAVAQDYCRSFLQGRSFLFDM